MILTGGASGPFLGGRKADEATVLWFAAAVARRTHREFDESVFWRSADVKVGPEEPRAGGRLLARRRPASWSLQAVGGTTDVPLTSSQTFIPFSRHGRTTSSLHQIILCSVNLTTQARRYRLNLSINKVLIIKNNFVSKIHASVDGTWNWAWNQSIFTAVQNTPHN